MSDRVTEAYNRVTGQDGQWTPEVVLEALTELDKSAYAEGAKFAAAHLATKIPTVEQLSEFLFTIYDHGTKPNALAEAGAILAFIAGADVTPAGPCPCACHEWPGGGSAHPHMKCRCHGGEGMSL